MKLIPCKNKVIYFIAVNIINTKLFLGKLKQITILIQLHFTSISSSPKLLKFVHQISFTLKKNYFFL